MSRPNPADVATATLAAHLLAESGSALTRALDLLELLGWRDDLDAIAEALTLANRKVQAVRGVVDGHLENIRSTATGRAPHASALAMLELGKEELRRAS